MSRSAFVPRCGKDIWKRLDSTYVTPDGWKSAVGLIFKVCNYSLEYPNYVILCILCDKMQLMALWGLLW